MTRVPSNSHAPRPSRRRGGRLRLKAEPHELQGTPVVGSWLSAITELVGDRAMHEGHLAARDGAVRSIVMESGAISGPVQADSEASKRVLSTFDVIDDSGWTRLVEAMACEAIWAAKLLESDMPPGLEKLFAGCGAPLVPAADAMSIEKSCARKSDGWRVAALAWIAAERLSRTPLKMLELRGLSREALVERLRHHRALRSQGEAAAHRPVVLDPGLAAGPPLPERIDSFWQLQSHVGDVPRESHVNHALLRRLGPSTLEGRFPLSGLLATIYDDVAAEAGRIIDAPGQYPEA